MKLDKVIAVRNSKTVYRDGDACIKVFGEDYSKADVLNEALNQARVEETGLNIPRIREVLRVDGKWAIISDYIEGKTISRLMKEDPDRRDGYLERFVDLQIDMQSRTAPLLNRLRDSLARKIVKAELDATTRYALHAQLMSMPVHNQLCHGDFHPSNIIIAADDTPYVMDWAHATQGDGSADVALTYLLLYHGDSPETADRYLTLFCDKSRSEPRYAKNWIPLVAAARSVRARGEERAALLRWVSAAECE